MVLSSELRERGRDVVRVVIGFLVVVGMADGGGCRMLSWSRSGGSAEAGVVGCGGAVEGASSVEVLLLLGSFASWGLNGGVVPVSSWLLAGGADGGRSAMVCWSCTWWWCRCCVALVLSICLLCVA